METPIPEDPSPHAQTLRGCGVAIAAIAAATVIRSGLQAGFGEATVFLPFTGAVVAAAWAGGLVPGLLATALGVVVASFQAVAPDELQQAARPGGGVELGLFALVGVAISWICDSLHAARRRAEAQTKRVAREAAVRRQAQQEVVAALESMTDGFWKVDRDWRLAYVNAAAEKIVGRRRDDVLGLSLWDVFPAFVGTALEAEARRVADAGASAGVQSDCQAFGKCFAVTMYPTPERGLTLITRDVTAQKRIDEAVRAAGERFRFAAEAVNGIIYEFDLATGRVERTRGLAEVLGWSPEEAPPTAAWWLEQIHPDDHREAQERFAAAMRAGEDRVTATYRVKHKDGRWLYVEDRSVVVRDASGKPKSMFGCSIDVTGRRRAEAFLARQNEVLELVATDAPLTQILATICRHVEDLHPNALCSIVLLDKSGTRLQLGAAPSLPEEYVQGLEGLRVEPPYIGPCGLALHRGESVAVTDVASDQNFAPRWRDLMTKGGLRSCRSTPVVAPDGAILAAFAAYGREAGEPIELDSPVVGLAVHLAAIAVERRRREASRRESEERLRLIVDSARDYAIVTFDHRGRVTGWNSGARNLFGYEDDEIVGRSGELIFTPEDRAERVMEYEMSAALETGRAENERWHLRKDGSRFWASGLSMPLHDGERALGFLKIMRDMTAAKRAEEMLLRQAEELRAADRKKDEFLAVLAHELRNPMAPLRSSLEVMKMAAGDKDVVLQVQTIMERQLSQLVRLVDDLLDVSRITRGKIELRKDRVELAAVVESALETVRPIVESAGLELVVERPDEPLTVEGDAVRLSQVFANLLNNAAKFTRRGGRVTVRLRSEDDQAIVSVADTGIGIPPEMLGQVFEMFTQVDRSLEKTAGGLGIGLSLVKGLVEMHGGVVSAHSEGDGRGAEFVVRLPVAARPTPIEAPPTEPVESSAPTANAGRRRVLVVDDNVDAARSMAMMLTVMGNEVRTAHDGQAGVAEAESFRPDLILMDIGMPKLNGYDACRTIREREWSRGTMMAALTGWGQKEDQRKSEEAGFDRHLVKPVAPEVLQTLLAELEAATAERAS